MITKPLPADEAVIEHTFNAVRVRQPIGDIIVGSIDAELIQKITFFDVRRVLKEERDIERYLGIQRPLIEKRVTELRKYVNFLDATFPTSIIVAVDSDYARYDSENFLMTLSNTKPGDDGPSIAIRSLCRVIDGQHRIEGLRGFEGECFEVPVSVFVGSDIADQAYVFATVNLEQTKVNKSLALDLYDLAKTRSPYKTCHNIAVALDTKEGSPFYRRIKRLGVTTEGRVGELLAQATVVNGIIDYISEDPKIDRDQLLRGKALERAFGDENEKRCFRNLFIDGEDVKIGKIIEQYFLAVEDRWRVAWNFGGKGLVLNRTNGFRALMSIFGLLYNHVAAPGEYVTKETFKEQFDKVDAEDNAFSTDNFKPGSSGEAALRQFLISHIFD